MLERSEHEDLRQRPAGKPVMLQSWRDLLFLHFPAPVDEVAPLLPKGLEVDTFPDTEGRESAWIGLVPFWMKGIRAPGMPALPWLSRFCETNVRTYVHRGGKEPGVWFFSLDAPRIVACQTARRLFSLNYVFSLMRSSRIGDDVSYASRRLSSPGRTQISGSLGPAMEPPVYGSFEFFAIERYLLYAQHRGTLCTGRVWHPPYPLRGVRSFQVQESLVEEAGIQSRLFEHAVFSEGVDVEVFPLSA